MRERTCAYGSNSCSSPRMAPGSSGRYDLGIRTSVGQKMHLPGQGYGLVRTVTVVTPESVRIGFIRIRSSRCASSRISPAATISLYIATSMDLLRYPPSRRGWLRSVLVTSRPRRISSNTVRARSRLSSVRRCVERQSSCRSVCILSTCIPTYSAKKHPTENLVSLLKCFYAGTSLYVNHIPLLRDQTNDPRVHPH